MLPLDKRKADRAHRKAVAAGEIHDAVTSTGVDQPLPNAQPEDETPVDPLDSMTVALLDDYITKRGGTPTGNRPDKLALAKTLPIEIPASGWGG